MGSKFKDHMIQALGVKKGDYVLGIQVTDVTNTSDGKVMIEGEGLHLQIDRFALVLITKAIIISDSSCITCGDRPVKYGQRLQCNTCYQRDRRAVQDSPIKSIRENSVAQALGTTYAAELTYKELVERRKAGVERH